MVFLFSRGYKIILLVLTIFFYTPIFSAPLPSTNAYQHDNRAYYYVGLANYAFYKEDFMLSYQNLVQARLYKPDDEYIEFRIVETILTILESSPELLARTERVVEQFSLDSLFIQPFYKLSGVFNLVQGNSAIAQSYFVDEITQNRTPEKGIFKILASIYNNQKDYEKEINLLRHAVEVYPEDAYFLNWLGYSLTLHTDEYKQAAKLLKKANRLEPNNLYYKDSLAWLYYMMGKHKKALKVISPFLDDEIVQTEIHYHIGMIYLKLGEIEKGKKYLQTAIKKNNDDNLVEEATSILEGIENER